MPPAYDAPACGAGALQCHGGQGISARDEAPGGAGAGMKGVADGRREDAPGDARRQVTTWLARRFVDDETSALAARAVERGALTLPQLPHFRAANPAGGAFAP